MKKFSIYFCAGVAGVVAVFAFFHFIDDSADQKTSASTQTPSFPQLGFENRMDILQKIPPVPGWEHPDQSAEDKAFYAAETQSRDELLGLFGGFQDQNRLKGSDQGSRGINRGTHAKGQCFQGTFTVLSDDELAKTLSNMGTESQEALIRRMKKGFLATPNHESASYPMVLRFANADGTGRIQNDPVGDVRGFSFSIRDVPTVDYTGAHRQDFMMNSTAAFASGEIHEFTKIVRAAGFFTYGKPLSGLVAVASEQIRADLAKVTKGDSEGKGIDSYASIPYWANLAYSHGEPEPGTHVAPDAVKYKVTPCAKTAAQPNLDKTDPDYLQKDIVNRAKDGPSVCFDFQVEFFNIEALRDSATDPSQKNWSQIDWVENGGLLWDESKPGLEFRTVARIEVAGDKLPTCTDQYINTRLHSNPANQPMGSIARVRTYVEEFSRARRMGEPLGKYGKLTGEN